MSIPALTGMSGTPHSQEDAFTPSRGGQRFFFDTYDGETLTRDEDGLVLEDLEQARDEAVQTSPDLARETLPHADRRDYVVEVRDEAGRKVWRASLSLVVDRLTE